MAPWGKRICMTYNPLILLYMEEWCKIVRSQVKKVIAEQENARPAGAGVLLHR